MNNKAIISWNSTKGKERYELHIDGVLKAYSDNWNGTPEHHEKGKQALIEIAQEKGYVVEIQENGVEEN